MSTVDTSTWNPDADLNAAIEGIPLNADAGIAQTWQALRILMAAVKGDGDAIKSMIDVMEGATASADGASGLVPKPEAGDQDKFLKGDGTWGNTPTPNLGTASRAVQTDANGVLAVSSVTATELGYLSGVTSAVQTQLDAKAADAAVVHLAGDETISGAKTFSTNPAVSGSGGTRLECVVSGNATSSKNWRIWFGHGNSGSGGIYDATRSRYIFERTSSNGDVTVRAYPDSNSPVKSLVLKSDGTATWDGQAIQTSSDERIKTPLSAVPDAVLDAWGDVGWGQFHFLEAVGVKGTSARLHLGLIAQRVKAAFEVRGLDACAYGILCFDDDRDMWTVRYAEALAMEAAFERRRADRLEARITALEEAMNA